MLTVFLPRDLLDVASAQPAAFSPLKPLRKRPESTSSKATKAGGGDDGGLSETGDQATNLSPDVDTATATPLSPDVNTATAIPLAAGEASQAAPADETANPSSNPAEPSSADASEPVKKTREEDKYRIKTLQEDDWPAICDAATAAALVPCKLYLQCRANTLLVALLRPDTVPPADLAANVQEDLKCCDEALRVATHEGQVREGRLALGTASAAGGEQPRAEGLHHLRYDPSSNALTGQCNTDWLQAELRYLPESRDSTRFVRAIGTLHGRLQDAQQIASDIGCNGSYRVGQPDLAAEGDSGNDGGGEPASQAIRGAAEPAPARPASVRPRMAPAPSQRAAETLLRRGGFVFHASTFFGVETFTQVRHTQSVPAALAKDAIRKGQAFGPASSGEHAHDTVLGSGLASGTSAAGSTGGDYEIADPHFPFEWSYGRASDVVTAQLVEAGVLPHII
jgi:hypothetical protein